MRINPTAKYSPSGTLFPLAGHAGRLALLSTTIAVCGCGQTSQPPASAATRPSLAPTAIPIAETAEPVTADSVPTPGAGPLQPEPLPVFRPDDQRPKHDDRRLADMGIQRYESQRLVLYTDIDPAAARTLPPLIDQAYQALDAYFGPLAPNRARTEFQMTGYLIKSEALFREAGLIPEDLPPFEHGRHRRNEFWMREQKYDYYRRHLLIHEVTHCFMTVMPDVEAPVWYMEGMAEYFGSHRLNPDGTAVFRVMPSSPAEFAGMGRINLLHDEYLAGRAKPISGVLELASLEYLKDEPYAWSWALCVFLDTHPRYQQRFREMIGYLQRNAFPTQFVRAFQADTRDLATEWQLFIQNIQYGYETAPSAIDFQPGALLTNAKPAHTSQIQAGRGWQSSGVLIEADQTYTVTATGRFELASQPRPWVSEPQGISFRYFNGRPLGLLLACIRNESGATDSDLQSMLTVYPIGKGGAFRAPISGTLYFRVNDEWNSLSNNRGQVEVNVSIGAAD